VAKAMGKTGKEVEEMLEKEDVIELNLAEKKMAEKKRCR
jgi:hypothetical protein